MKKKNKNHNTIDIQLFKKLQICRMKLHIGDRIQQQVKESNVTITGFAEMINKERSNVYDIFKRENIDTGLLSIICKVLKYDFFKLFSDELKRDLNILDEPKEEKIKEERRIMIEVKLTEQEYQNLLRKRVL